jgi:hypothetical protein
VCDAKLVERSLAWRRDEFVVLRDVTSTVAAGPTRDGSRREQFFDKQARTLQTPC